jgi:hypothetical protein
MLVPKAKIPLQLWWKLTDTNNMWFTIDQYPVRDGKPLINTLAVVYRGDRRPSGPDEFAGFAVIYTNLADMVPITALAGIVSEV